MRLLVPLLAVVLLAGACSGTAATSPSAAASAATSPAGSGASAVCDDVAALRTSITALKDIKLLEVGTSGVKAAVEDVKAKAEALKASLGAALSQPVDDLLTAVTALQTSITNLGDKPSLGAAAVSIKTSIEQVGTSAAALGDALSSTCPSS